LSFQTTALAVGCGWYGNFRFPALEGRIPNTKLCATDDNDKYLG